MAVDSAEVAMSSIGVTIHHDHDSSFTALSSPSPSSSTNNNNANGAFGKSAATFVAHIKQHAMISVTPKSPLAVSSSSLTLPSSSTPSGAPVDSNEPLLITKPLTPTDNDSGRIAIPQLLPRPNGSCSVSTKTREEWATISNEEAVRLLFDINSRVGEADLSLWNDQQLKYLVDVIEPGIVL
jgi:hypothetical protein